MTTGEVIALIKAFGGSGGGGGGSSVLAVTDTEGTLNKTWQEIYNAFNAGTAVIIKSVGDGYDYGDLILCVYYEGNEFGVKLKSADYYADSATDYPVIGR